MPRINVMGLATVACILGLSGSAFAQTSGFGMHIIRTRPAQSVVSTGARAPGTMVNSAVARTLANAAAARPFIEITEVHEPGSEPRHEFLIETIEIVFEQVDTALLFFENLLRARAGLPPRVPEVPGGNNDDEDPRNPRGGR